MQIEELEFRIQKDKNKLRTDLEVASMFFKEIDIDVYLHLYDEIAEDRMKYERISIQLEKDLNEVNRKIGKIRSELLFNEGIDLESRIFEFGLNKGAVLDKLFQCGVLSIDRYEKVKDLLWEKRYRKVYSD